jgi:hypothetical protein
MLGMKPCHDVSIRECIGLCNEVAAGHDLAVLKKVSSDYSATGSGRFN